MDFYDNKPFQNGYFDESKDYDDSSDKENHKKKVASVWAARGKRLGEFALVFGSAAAGYGTGKWLGPLLSETVLGWGAGLCSLLGWEQMAGFIVGATPVVSVLAGVGIAVMAAIGLHSIARRIITGRGLNII